MGWYEFASEDSETHPYAWAVAGACSVLATVLTVRLVFQHLKNYRHARRQRYVVRILWMVPIYAIASFLSMVFIDNSVVFDVPRDIYESYVIYNFLALCVDYMGGEDEAQAYFAKQPPMKHGMPFCCLGYHTMEQFLDTCRVYVLQYSIVKPITAVLTLSLYWSGDLEVGDLSFGSANFWIQFINNVSVTVALYYLIAFYHASRGNIHLQRGRPLPKFIAVKAIIFFAFWQTLMIDILSESGVMRRSVTSSRDDLRTGLSDFLLCVEMAIVAVTHTWIFSAKEHQSGFYHLSCDEDASQGVQIVEMNSRDAAKNMLDVKDLVLDIGHAASHLPKLGSTINAAAADWLIPHPKAASYREGLRREVERLPEAAVLSPLYRAVVEDPEVVALNKRLKSAKGAQERLQLRAKLAAAERLATQRLAGTAVNDQGSSVEDGYFGHNPAVAHANGSRFHGRESATSLLSRGER